MKFTLKLILVLLVVTGLAVLAHKDQGYVLLSVQDVTVELSLVLALIVVFVTAAVVYYLAKFLWGTWTLPEQLGEWSGRRRAEKASIALNKGTVQLSEGDWKTAEKTFLKAAAKSERPLVSYLAAADAADRQQAFDRRDRYLALAHEKQAGADVAIKFHQAEMSVQRKQYREALGLLDQVIEANPRQQHALKLKATIYRELEAWGDLKELMPQLKKMKAYSVKEQHEINYQMHVGLLLAAINSNDHAQIEQTWAQLPVEWKEKPSIALPYALYQLDLKQPNSAEKVLRAAIKSEWDDPLVYLYGLLVTEAGEKQLSFLSGWQNAEPENPVLLLSLGRCAARLEQWEQAQSYFEASIKYQPQAESYSELAKLLTTQGQSEKAADILRLGLDCAVKKTAPVTIGNGRFSSTDNELATGRDHLPTAVVN